MTQVDDKVIERIKKLLALANNNDNEHQAAAAMEKAQAMLEEHNLDMAVLGTSGKGAQRNDTKRSGGLYSWQRKLWAAVAELNFCYYFSLKGLKKGSVYEHRLIGSHANVIATEVMAKYLQEAVERLAQQWAKENSYKSVFVREAIAYREGMTNRISVRLHDRRNAQMEVARRETEKRDAAREASSVTGRELTIVDIVSTEADFNNDYLNGWEMGTTARNRRESELRSKAWHAAYAEKARKQAEWDAAHPAEAAARNARIQAENDAYWAKYEKKANRRKEPTIRYRRATPEEERAGLSSFYEGYRKGDTVGIDQQVDRKERRRIG